MAKYYGSITIADKSWTKRQRESFEASIFNSLGAERNEAIGNLYTFDIRFDTRNDAFLFVTQYFGIAFQCAGVQETDYYLTLSNTRGFNTHMTI